MTTINLNYGYFIEIDPLNHTLKQKFTGKTKSGEEKESVKVIGYYGCLMDAVTGYLHHAQIGLLDRKAFEMIEYVKTIEQINKTAVSVLYEVVKGE